MTSENYTAPEEKAEAATPLVYAPVCPPENTPLSPWAYFGLKILFAIPIVGFIFLIIFSCKRDNINRRNFARSYWCDLIIYAAIILIYVIIFAIVGGSMVAMLN